MIKSWVKAGLNEIISMASSQFFFKYFKVFPLILVSIDTISLGTPVLTVLFQVKMAAVKKSSPNPVI